MKPSNFPKIRRLTVADLIVEIKDLVRTYGRHSALDKVNFTLERGIVLGLVGQNGAGKTTLIKHILGLLRAESGEVRVFGVDPVADPQGVLSRIGYLSEEGDLPLWMKVEELIRYSAAFYPGWDPKYAETLQKQFGLSSDSKLGSLSKGQRARAGLLVALAFKPDLLLLDEPSSGLDPVVRKDILSAVIRTIADEGRTVLFSSHLLAEVEQVSDRVVMIEDGRIVLDDELANIKESYFRIDLRFGTSQPVAPNLEGSLHWDGVGKDWTVIWSGDPEALTPSLTKLDGRIVAKRGVSLDEIFVAYAGGASKP